MTSPDRGIEEITSTEKKMQIQTNWWVITGGPSSGKTTLIDRLHLMGYKTVPESTRIIIDEGIAEGKSLDEIRKDRVVFQRVVFARKEAIEETLPQSVLTFLDRGSLGDTLAYLSLSLGQQEPDFSVDFPGKDIILKTPKRRYQGVFLLDPLPFEADYARTEDEETARRIHQLLRDIYSGLGYEPIVVPVMSVEERISFILERAGINI